MNRSPLTAVALSGAIALCAALAPTASAAALSVTPASGPVGTSFTISFAAPTAQAAGYYHVRAKASDARGGSCVSTLTFSNPAAVSAGLRIRFTFRPTAAEELCPGAWTVSVSDPSGDVLISGGHFELAKHGVNAPPTPTPTTTTSTTTTTTRTTSTTPPVPAKGAVSVTPASGGFGTTFTISFLTPAAVAADGLSVQARATSKHKNVCVSSLHFTNPRAESANVKIQFTFAPIASEELCTGSWSVSVRNAATSQTVLSGGSFTLR